MSVTEFQRSSERWDSTSNGRIDSTSSPKNSMRTGSVESVGKTSRMPPRTLNSPGTSTTSARDMPRSSSQAVSSSTGTASPTATVRDIRASASGLGTGCKRRLKRRDDQPRRVRARELLEHPHPPAEDLVGGVQLARQLLPGGEDLGHDPGERRHVVAEVVDVADVGQHDHQRRGCMQPKRGGRQGRRRAPGAVDRRAAAVLERRQDLGKPRRALDLARQVLELPDGGALRGSTRTLGHGQWRVVSAVTGSAGLTSDSSYGTAVVITERQLIVGFRSPI